MNAVHPLPHADVDRRIGEGPGPWPDAQRAQRLVRKLALLHLVLLAAVLAMLVLPGVMPAALREGGLGGVAAGSIMLPLAGLLATVPVVRARARLGEPVPAAAGSRMPGRFGRLLGRDRPRVGADPVERLARVGRRPQGVIVPVLSGAAVAALWLLRGSGT